MSKNIDNQIAEYLNWCQNVADYTKQTLSSKMYILRRFAEHTEISDIFELDLERFSAWRNGMLSGALTGKIHKSETVNTRIKALRSFIRWATDYYDKKPAINLIMIQKVRAIKVVPEYTFYTENQIRVVVEKSKKIEQIMISLLFESGLRISEFQQIRVGDINFSTGEIFIIGKGRKPAMVYFSFKTGLDIQNYINARGLSKSDYLWRSDYSACNAPLTIKTIRKWLKEAFDRCGFSNFYPHQLRHSFATNLAVRGATIYEIQHLLRHSDIRTTQIYLHHLQNRLNDTYRRIFNEEIYYLKSPIA